MGEKTNYGYKHNDGHYSKMTGGKGDNSSYSIYNTRPDSPNHTATHVNINSSNKTFTVTEHGSDGKSTTTSGGCYLTSACIKHFQENFDDNCHELTVLRWFRDTFVSPSDIEHYYEVAPRIVSAIDESPQADAIYELIFNRVIAVCVKAIEEVNYDLAYALYRESILALEQNYLGQSRSR